MAAPCVAFAMSLIYLIQDRALNEARPAPARTAAVAQARDRSGTRAALGFLP